MASQFTDVWTTIPYSMNVKELENTAVDYKYHVHTLPQVDETL
jgi:hypothetical protein